MKVYVVTRQIADHNEIASVYSDKTTAEQTVYSLNLLEKKRASNLPLIIWQCEEHELDGEV